MSLLGYFWLFNTLNILDGLLTIWGIELGVFSERNHALLFYVDKLGLNSGMFFIKFIGFALSLLLYRRKSKLGFFMIIVPYAVMVCFQIISIIEWWTLVS